MSRHELVICDQCGKTEDNSPSFMKLVDWTNKRAKYNDKEFHFCSWPCLSKYSKGKA